MVMVTQAENFNPATKGGDDPAEGFKAIAQAGYVDNSHLQAGNRCAVNGSEQLPGVILVNGGEQAGAATFGGNDSVNGGKAVGTTDGGKAERDLTEEEQVEEGPGCPPNGGEGTTDGGKAEEDLGCPPNGGEGTTDGGKAEEELGCPPNGGEGTTDGGKAEPDATDDDVNNSDEHPDSDQRSTDDAPSNDPAEQVEPSITQDEIEKLQDLMGDGFDSEYDSIRGGAAQPGDVIISGTGNVGVMHGNGQVVYFDFQARAVVMGSMSQFLGSAGRQGGRAESNENSRDNAIVLRRRSGSGNTSEGVQQPAQPNGSSVEQEGQPNDAREGEPNDIVQDETPKCPEASGDEVNRDGTDPGRVRDRSPIRTAPERDDTCAAGAKGNNISLKKAALASGKNGLALPR